MQTGLPQAEPRRAIIAAMTSDGAKALSGALADAGCAVVGTAGDVDGIVALARRTKPEILLADAILPGGDAVSVARRLADEPLETHPFALLVRPAGLAVPGADGLERLGAALVEKPLRPEALNAAIAAFEARAHALPEDKSARLASLLDALGVPEHPGRALLTNAVALAWRDRRRIHNLRDRVYPDAGRPLDRTPAQTERAIRHVIDAAWRTGEIERQHKIFGDTIDARRGRPTCGEMIAQLADILRWEGRP